MSMAGDRGPVAGLVLAGGWAVGLVLAARTIRRDGRGLESWKWALVVGWTVGSILGAFALSLAGAPIFRDKYLIGALPGACLLAAAGLVRLRPKPLLVVAVAIVLVSSFARIVSRADEHHQGENWRAIGAYAVAETGGEDRFVFYAPWMAEGLEHYLRQAGDEHPSRHVLVPGEGWMPFADSPVRVDHYTSRDLDTLCAARGVPLWFVIHDVRGNDVSLESMESAIERTHVLATEQAFSMIVVRNYQPRPSTAAPPVEGCAS